MKKIIALFPGQGSQKIGMGKDLFDQYDLAKNLFAKADQALGFSLSEICFNGPEDSLKNTAIAQPAILTVSVICYELSKQHFNPCAAAGHSLGEYSALVAAGALKFEDAVLLVHKRGKYMQEAVPVGAGKMVAVLGKEISEIEAAIKQVNSGVVEIANINAPGQVVVAGAKNAVEDFAKILGGKIIELAVSAPFHCALMQPAAEKLATDLDQMQISDCKFPVYSNVTANPVIKAAEIRQALKDQVCSKVRWVESMQNLVAQAQPESAVEFGAGNVLTGLLKRISADVARANVGSVKEIEGLVA